MKVRCAGVARAVVLPAPASKLAGDPVRTMRTSQNRDMGHPNRSCSGSCRVAEWSDGIVEGAVGVEGFARAFFEEKFVVAEETVDRVAFFDGDEEYLSLAFAPDVREIFCSEKDGWGVGECPAEEHGGRAAVDERDIAAEVEGDR